jgi:polyphosphate kinase 2 (PPK2 family)
MGVVMAEPKAGENSKMKRNDYEKELRKLQVELCRLQEWVKAEGAKIIVVFEGRDAGVSDRLCVGDPWVS